MIRRLKTSSTGLATEEVEEVLEDFMGEMAAMGNPENFRVQTLRSAMIGYMRTLGKVARGLTNRNRKGHQTLQNRRY